MLWVIIAHMKEAIVEKLHHLVARSEELGGLLSDPEVISDQNRFRDFAREYSQLEPVVALLRETEAIGDSQDTARLRRLWDTEDPDPYYLAGEQENWFVGWDAINSYLAPPA